jgi:hypothetical protein
MRVIVIRAGNVFSSYYKTDIQNEYGLVRQETCAMNSSVLVGASGSSGKSSVQSTVVFEEMAVRAQPLISYSDETVTGSNTYGYRARGVTE